MLTVEVDTQSPLSFHIVKFHIKIDEEMDSFWKNSSAPETSGTSMSHSMVFSSFVFGIFRKDDTN